MLTLFTWATSDSLSSGALLVAIIAAIIAIRGNSIAKKAYNISKKDYKNRQSKFSLYLIGGYKIRLNDSNSTKVLCFNLTILNQSHTQSSFRSRLEIDFVRVDNTKSTVVINYDPKLVDAVKNTKLEAFETNVRLEENGLKSGWYLFKQPDIIDTKSRIEKYSVIISDPTGEEQAQAVYILKEMTNEQEENNS